MSGALGDCLGCLCPGLILNLCMYKNKMRICVVCVFVSSTSKSKAT